MRAKVEFQDQEVRRALNRLIELGGDLTPAMKAAAGHLEAGVEDAFDRQRSPADGAAWADLSDVTKARREKRDKWPGKILQVTGDLAGSISSGHDARSAVAGTNLVYAPTQQFGAERGEFGSTKRGAPIPWGDIPARPFLGASEETRGEIRKSINRLIRAAWRGRR